jgi:hypothetical protein
MNEQFVYIKLVTGEQLMAYKESEDDKSVLLKFPMLIKTHLVGMNNGRISEQVTAGPYTLFVDSTSFHVNKDHIIVDAQLAPNAIPHYVHLVRDHEGVSLSYIPQELEWEETNYEEEKVSIPDVAKAIQQLKALAEVEKEVDEKFLLKGNDTVH